MDNSFAETEIIAILTSLVSMYKIELHPDLVRLDVSSLMDMVSDVKPGLSLWSVESWALIPFETYFLVVTQSKASATDIQTEVSCGVTLFRLTNCSDHSSI